MGLEGKNKQTKKEEEGRKDNTTKRKKREKNLPSDKYDFETSPGWFSPSLPQLSIPNFKVRRIREKDKTKQKTWSLMSSIAESTSSFRKGNNSGVTLSCTNA